MRNSAFWKLLLLVILLSPIACEAILLDKAEREALDVAFEDFLNIQKEHGCSDHAFKSCGRASYSWKMTRADGLAEVYIAPKQPWYGGHILGGEATYIINEDNKEIIKRVLGK